MDRLFCRTLVGRLFVFHVLALHKPVISFGFHCVDSARAWRLPEGLGAGEALAPTQRNRDTALLWFMPHRRREEGLVQERRQLHATR